MASLNVRVRPVSIRVWLLAVMIGASGCAMWSQPPGIGRAVSWARVPGWTQDRHAEAWPALLSTCDSRAARSGVWPQLCAAARQIAAPSDAQARAFFETWFVPHRVHANDGSRRALVTGYYEPILFGSRTPDSRYRFPLYRRPQDLLVVDLTAVYPELRGKPLRGRLDGQRVVPYGSRADIEAGRTPLAGAELLWVDDAIALFFLQIQGAGRVMLPDDTQVSVGYADQNGYPYVPVGKCLIERGILKSEEVSLQSIRAWLQQNPAAAPELLNCNPSYIFFQERNLPAGVGPIGSLQVPLTTLRSVAVDTNHIALGAPLWLATTDPLTGNALRRLVFAQDTGGAIRGPTRIDLFCGQGLAGETLAGQMKQDGELLILQPRAAKE